MIVLESNGNSSDGCSERLPYTIAILIQSFSGNHILGRFIKSALVCEIVKSTLMSIAYRVTSDPCTIRPSDSK